MDGEKFSGDAKNIRLKRETEGSTWGFRFEEISPNYRADVGFVTQTGFKNISLWHSRTYRSNNFFRLIKPNITVRKKSDFEGNTIQEMTELGLFFETSKNFKGNIERKIFDNEQYKTFAFNEQQTRTNLWLNYSPSELFSIGFSADFGDRIAYNELIPEIGKQKNYNLNLGLRPNDKLSYPTAIAKLSFQKNIKPAAILVVALIDFQRAIHSIMIYPGALILNRMIFLMITTLRRYLNGGRIHTQFFYAGSSQFFSDGESSNNVKLLTSQIYLKFQYFYKI